MIARLQMMDKQAKTDAKKNETKTTFLSIAKKRRNWILQLKIFPKAG